MIIMYEVRCRPAGGALRCEVCTSNIRSDLEQFNLRKRAVTGKWHMDETYIKVRGRWMYL